MIIKFQECLDTVDQAVLAPLVSRALLRAKIDIIDWHHDLLNVAGGQFFGVIGMVRFSGRVRDRSTGDQLAWSMILKAFAGNPDAEDGDITHYAYWKREVLAYQSDLLTELPSALAAPRCYGVVEYPGNQFWVWMEDLGDGMAERWPLDRYGLAAESLGRFNGAYLTGRPIPTSPWLSRGRVRNLLEMAAPVIATLEGRQKEPVVRRWLREGRLARVQRLWAQRDHLLKALDALPRTLCHHDAFCRNLLVTDTGVGDNQLIGIDWSMVGTGAIGEEIAPLVSATLYFLDVNVEDAPALDRIVFNGYLDGLRAAGWQGDARLARFGYAATMALFGGLGNLAWLDFFVDDEGFVEAFFAHHPEQVVDALAGQLTFELDLGDEALDLMDQL